MHMAKAFDLTGRVAIVTGSSRGLGLAMARGLAEVGARVVVCARSKEQVESVAAEITAAGGTAAALAVDVTQREECELLVEFAVGQFGCLDVMVANHGGGIPNRQPAIDETDEAWDYILRLNLTGAFYCCQTAARRMIGQGSGSIIVVSSTSSTKFHPNLLAYGAAKAGVEQMVRQFAGELGRHNIRVNSVGVGYTTHRPRAPKIDPNSEFDRHVNARTPLGRSAAPWEIAGPVVFLASDGASYVTGASLPIEGGYLVS